MLLIRRGQVLCRSSWIMRGFLVSSGRLTYLRKVGVWSSLLAFYVCVTARDRRSLQLKDNVWFGGHVRPSVCL